MRIYRLVEVEVPDDLEGICWNESMSGKIVWKRADSKMCSVGIIRRGRSWGDYDGKYCAECPYFLMPNCLYDHERNLLKRLAKELGMSVNDLLELLASKTHAPRLRSPVSGDGPAEHNERATCSPEFFTILSSARKLLEATLQVLKLANKPVVDKLMIMKTAYLIQREHFKAYGKHFVDLPFFKYVYGPYNQLVLVALDEFAQQGLIEQTDDLEFNSATFSSKCSLPSEVSRSVAALLNKFKYSFDLTDYVRKLPEVMKTRFGEEIKFEEGA